MTQDVSDYYSIGNVPVHIALYGSATGTKSFTFATPLNACVCVRHRSQPGRRHRLRHRHWRNYGCQQHGPHAGCLPGARPVVLILMTFQGESAITSCALTSAGVAELDTNTLNSVSIPEGKAPKRIAALNVDPNDPTNGLPIGSNNSPYRTPLRRTAASTRPILRHHRQRFAVGRKSLGADEPLDARQQHAVLVDGVIQHVGLAARSRRPRGPRRRRIARGIFE